MFSFALDPKMCHARVQTFLNMYKHLHEFLNLLKKSSVKIAPELKIF